jgi:hypothetical protein
MGFVWIYSEMATVHFSAAAERRPAAVTADKEGENESTVSHAFKVFLRQLNALSRSRALPTNF